MASPLDPDDPRLRAAIAEFATEFLIFTDQRGNVAVTAGAGLEAAGFDRRLAADGRHIAERIHPDDLPAVLDLIERARADARFSDTILARARSDDGRWRTFDSTVIGVGRHPVLGTGAVVRVRATGQADDAVKEGDDRFSSLSALVPHGVLSGDRRGWVVFANAQAGDLLGLGREEVLGDGWRRVVHPDDLDEAIGTGDRVVRQGTPQHATVRVLRAAEERVVALTVMPLGSPTRRTGWVATLEDATERHTKAARLTHLATHDPLTGLPNRALLQDRLAQVDARRARVPGALAVLFVDLDGFKAVNDTLGHAAGDEVLRMVADQLLAAIRPGDTVARVGGDEFVVILDDLPAEEAERLADRLTEDLNRPATVQGRPVRLGASVGLAVAAAGEPAADVIRRADAAMYRQKGRRR